MALVGALASAVVLVGASPASAETTIKAQAGANGWFWPGHRVPIVVTVEADRLIQGSVRVALGGQVAGPTASAVVDIPIEVSGGSAKRVVAVLPSSSILNGNAGGAAFGATVELRERDVVISSANVTANFTPWVEAVGILPKFAGLGQLPETTPLPHSAGMAHLVTIAPETIDAGAAALEVFPTIVAHPADLAELSPAGRAAVVSWLGDGGHLLVDAGPGAVNGLPDAWQPTSGWARAGNGDVRTTGGAAQSGRWSDVLIATSAGMTPANNNNNGMGFSDPSSLVVSLGRDAGFQLPQLGVLLGFLVLYVLLAGPITFIVLAKLRRRTLAWLVVPALAALFTSIFAVGGARLRESVDSAHATVIDLAPGGARGYSTVLVGSINGGRTELELPANWGPDSAASQFSNFMTGGSVQTPVATITRDAGRTLAKLSLAPGEFDLVRASGPVSGFDRALVVEATSNGSTINGTITNNLDVPLEEATAIVNGKAVDVGSLVAHESKVFTVATPLEGGGNNGGFNGGMFFGIPEANEWPIAQDDMGSMSRQMMGGQICDNTGCHDPSTVDRNSDTAVNMAAWTLYSTENTRRIRRTSSVTAIGWTKEVPPPLRLDGDHDLKRGRTAILAHADIRVSKLDSVGLAMEQVRDNDLRKEEERKGEGERPPKDEFVNGPVFRFTLPTNVDGSPLDPTQILLRAPVDLHRLAILSSDGWRITPELLTAGIAYRLRPEDVISGTVTVQARAGDYFSQRPITTGGIYAGWRFVTEGPAEDEVGATPPDQAAPAAPPPPPATAQPASTSGQTTTIGPNGAVGVAVATTIQLGAG